MRRPTANAYLPDRVSLPGETLREVLEDRQMSQAELAERTGRPKKTINEIIQGKASITAETALQLERVLGIPATFWNNLERNYQESKARQQEETLLEDSSSWLGQVPVRELENFGWIERKTRPADRVREVLNFFGVASPNEWNNVFQLPQASFRHSASFESEPGALAAWLRKGEIEARRIHCQSFDKSGFEAALGTARSLTLTKPEEFVPRLTTTCAEAGVAVVFVRELTNCRAHGATRWLSSSKALIQLSLRYKTDDHLWFTFFHEAGHILLHNKRTTFIEDDDSKTSAEEEEANRFAADFLIPRRAIEEFQRSAPKQRFSAEKIRTFARQVGIAPGIVVGRLQHERWLPHSHLNQLKVRLDWAN